MTSAFSFSTECTAGSAACSPNSNGCINAVGRYTCAACKSGFEGNGFVCNPSGSIAVLPSSVQNTLYFGGSVTLGVKSFANGAALVQYAVTGLPSSAYFISGASVNGSCISFGPNATTYFNLTVLPVTQETPQTTLTITLSRPAGAAREIVAPGTMAIVVQAFGAASGIVTFTFPDPLSVVLGQSQLVYLNRQPPSAEAVMPALSVSWSTDTVFPVTGTVVFPAGVSTVALNLTIPSDSVPRLGYNASLRLLATGGVTLGLLSQVTLMIPNSNNPNGLLQFSATSFSTTQGSSVSRMSLLFMIIV